MASVADCERALEVLAARLAAAHPDTRQKADFERSLSCTLTDLGISFTGRLGSAQLREITRIEGEPPERAQVRLRMTSDDLIALVDGSLNLPAAWASGRVKIEAGIRDLLRLRTLF